jgi:hypothetical protein
MYKQQAENNEAPTQEPQGDSSETGQADYSTEESDENNNDGDDVIDAEFTEK